MPPPAGETLERLAEFQGLADRLQMPESERRGILGVGEAAWPAIAAAAPDCAEIHTDEFRRRLGYILPLMRRAVANRAGAEPGPSPLPS